MNPFVEAALKDHASGAAFGVGALVAAEAGAGGVSSFGYSGTIAHAVVQASSGSARARGIGAAAVVPYKCRLHGWRASPHPFAQQLLDGASPPTFTAPCQGALHATVADHVVHGRVVFPGAGYLEMARAAACASCHSALGAAVLHRVYFMQPLLVSDSLLVACVVDADARRFEISSSLVDRQEEQTVHCAGDAEVVDATSRAVEPVAAVAACPRPFDSRVLYAVFCSVGLQYGPAFQALDVMWATRSGAQAAASLRRRSDMQGTQAHPADLDGALQHTALLYAQSASSQGETRLPFSVGEASMKSTPHQLRSVRFEPGALRTTQR